MIRQARKEVEGTAPRKMPSNLPSPCLRTWMQDAFDLEYGCGSVSSGGKKTRTMCFKKERQGQMEEDKDKVDKWFAMSQAYPRKRNRHTHTHQKVLGFSIQKWPRICSF